MKAIIMAGGMGTRLQSVTGALPKPMVPLLGRPLMEHIVALLRENGVREICAALRYNPEPIMEHFGDGSAFGVSMEYRLEKTALGTAGGVKNCADFYGEDSFLVISGDAACDFDLSALMAEHSSGGAAVTMALCESADPRQYGLVLPDGEGRVRCFIEKPGWDRVVTDLVNTGIYMVSPLAMSYVPPGRSFDFARELFPLLMDSGQVIRGAVMEGYWCDIGTPRAYYRCCLDALDGVLRLGRGPEEPAAESAPAPAPPLPGRVRASLALPCRDRAGLMRRVSECLMEAGADFSWGVTVSGRRCGVRVAPMADRSELRIEAASDDGEFTALLANALFRTAEALEGP